MVKVIMHYLAGMIEQGSIFTPHNSFKLDCYNDADFARLCSFSPGYGDECPLSNWLYYFLLWMLLDVEKSAPMETVLSAFHMEYVALSMAM